MQRSDIRAVGDLAGEASSVLTTLVRGMHAGISGRDLRFGACLDEDWADADPDEFLRHRCHEAPFLPHARYHFGSSSVAPALLGLIAGDHLVRPKSAAGLGKSRRIPFEPELGLTLTGLNHFDLLNHPLVYAKLHDWLAHSPDRSPGVSDTGGDVNGDG